MPDKPKIACLSNGPYYLLNDTTPTPVANLRRANGEACVTVRGVALCRCGGSKNKPFCDGSHGTIGFKDAKTTDEDEAHNCGLIGEQLKKRGKDYSHATGEFYDKAVAVKGARERIGYLVRGLKWAIREFEQALPNIPDTETRQLFQGMRERHLRSIAACESLLQTRSKQ